MSLLEIVEIQDTSAKLYFKNVPLSTVNAIRRLIISQVTGIAIVDAKIHQNTSFFYDEDILSRLSLLPIRQKVALPMQCHYCKTHCSQCSLECNVKCANNTLKRMEVTTSHITYNCKEMEFLPDIPFLTLRPNEVFEATMWVKLGNGSIHTKFMPQTSILFKPQPTITMDKTVFSQEQRHILSKTCPKKIFDSDLNLVNPEQCTYCEDCTDQIEEWGIPNAIQIQSIPNEYQFELETIDTKHPIAIVKEALDIFLKQVNDLLQLVEQQS